MDDELIESDRLSLRRKSLLPGAGFFYPDSLDEEYAEATQEHLARARKEAEEAKQAAETQPT